MLIGFVIGAPQRSFNVALEIAKAKRSYSSFVFHSALCFWRVSALIPRFALARSFIFLLSGLHLVCSLSFT